MWANLSSTACYALGRVGPRSMSGAAFSPLACCIVAFENVVRRDEASLASTGLREHDDAWYKRQRDERRSIPNPAGGVIHVARVHRAPRLSALWLLLSALSVVVLALLLALWLWLGILVVHDIRYTVLMSGYAELGRSRS